MTSDTPDDRTVIRPAGPSPTVQGAAPFTPKAAQDNELPLGTRLGEFELLKVIGEGGFSIVYLAHDHSLDRQVAVKEYMPSALASRNGQTQVSPKSERHRDTFEAGLKSFVNEAKLLARFDHPSLVKVYRFWEANGTAYMVMPLYQGQTLKEWLQSLRAPPDEAALLALLAPLTEALKVIHVEHCFHRDIAPDNIILLADGGKPLLLDFGAARRVIGDMTQALTVILKPGYAPIEQYAESPGMKQGPWTDVYALAATVYFCITGKTPPPAVGRLIEDGSQPLSEMLRGRYSERFLSAIDRALKVRPEERTASIEAFQNDLGLIPGGMERIVPASSTLFESSPTTQRSAPQTPVSASTQPSLGSSQSHAAVRSSTSFRRKVWMALGLGAVVGAAALTTFLATRGEKDSRPAQTPSTGNVPTAPPAPVATATPPAPPAQPPTVIVAPEPAVFNAQQEFDRLPTLQTPGYGVEAAAEKERLRIGIDHLKFKVTSAVDGYVHVLVLGPEGSVIQLFPNTKATAHRIAAGQTLTLPQKHWLLDTLPPAGLERFLVIVSKTPRDYEALGSSRESWFLKLPNGEAANRLTAQLGAGTHLLLGKARGCNGSNCDEFAAARFDVEVVAP